jgi:hypothetical protein
LLAVVSHVSRADCAAGIGDNGDAEQICALSNIQRMGENGFSRGSSQNRTRDAGCGLERTEIKVSEAVTDKFQSAGRSFLPIATPMNYSEDRFLPVL